jgi:phytoene/squalene synthetase
MADMAGVEFDHCRELALRPGGVFEFTSRFIAPRSREALLGVYALKQAICTIPHAQVDDSVKWEKLKWWGEELLADPQSSSRHPVLRALQMSGARQKLQDKLLLQLVSDAVMQIDMPPFADEQSLFERFAALGSSEIELELALDEAGVGEVSRDLLGAASIMSGLILSFAPNQRSQTERLPLSLLAKFSIGSDDLGQADAGGKLSGVVAELVSVAIQWFSKGLKTLEISAAENSGLQAAAHLQLRWAMEKRRLENIAGDVDGFLQTGTRFGPGDAWYAWRTMRKLS